jgi:ubiquinol-cytochrome c reductase iron-sulfur subunit
VTDMTTNHGAEGEEPSRRDFIHIATGAVFGVGAAAVAWPFVDQWNPALDTRALASINVDLNTIPEGSVTKKLWRGKPIFIAHLPKSRVAELEATPMSDLKDPQTYTDRVKTEGGEAGNPQFLIMAANCTHLGCVPLADAGDFGTAGGYLCPCHGSHYDAAGRIRKGPAPLNLPVIPHTYTTATTVKIG